MPTNDPTQHGPWGIYDQPALAAPDTTRERVAAVLCRVMDHGDHPFGCPESLDAAPELIAAAVATVTSTAPITVKTVEQLKALPSRAAVMDMLGDVGVLGVGGIYYPETAPVSLEYAAKHWGPFTVLTPATPERSEQEREAAVERAAEAGRKAWLTLPASRDDTPERWWLGVARAAIAAYEGREVSE